MAENTKIEWAHHTHNHWYGCTKVSPGCDHCYAEGWAKRSGLVQWGSGAERRLSSESNRRKPLAWNATAKRLGVRYRVFCSSLADVFDNEVPAAWRQSLMTLVADTPHLDWMLLTKRIGNARKMLVEASMHDGRLLTANDEYAPPPNLWIGATIVNQEEADRDIPKLMNTPAAVRFVSMEPLLGPVNLRHLNEGKETNEIDALQPYLWEQEVENWRDTSDTWEADFADWYNGVTVAHATGPMHEKVDLVIVGGESGPGARPMHPDWARSLRDQCSAASVPFMFKQWGEWLPAKRDAYGNVEFCDQNTVPHDGFLRLDTADLDGAHTAFKFGKKAAGRLLDGALHDGLPGHRS